MRGRFALGLALLAQSFACSSDETPKSPGAGATNSAGGANSAGNTSMNGGQPGGAGAAPGNAGSQSGGTSNQAGANQAGANQAGASTILPPFGPAPEDKPDTVEIGVRNNCPFPLWIHAQGKQGALMPDDKQLMKGEHIWYDAPKQWEAARITAYGDGPRQGELDKVEMTLVENGAVLNYNVTYVDWVALPMEMIARGGGDCKQVGCYVPEADILAGCPDGLLDGKRCQAARTYCFAGKNADQAYCQALDSVVQTCATTKAGCEGAAQSNTSNAYSCDGFFAGSPKWCAAVNRGMLDDPDNKDTKAYYQKAPYNTYAKWVHSVCPGIYAFAYDDYPPNAEESGFHACNQGKELEITFCPAG